MDCSCEFLTIVLVLLAVGAWYICRAICRNIDWGNDFTAGALRGRFRRVTKPEIMQPHDRVSFFDAFSAEIEAARLENRRVDIDGFAAAIVEGISHGEIEKRAAAARLMSARNESHVTLLPAPNNVAPGWRSLPSKSL